MKKLLIIIATDDREKALAALDLAVNSAESRHYEDIKLFFYGPSEKLISEDEELQGRLAALIQSGVNPFACVNLGERFEVTPKLEELGMSVVLIGREIADALGEDFIPLVF
jgi:hypothetical protein